MESQHQSWEVHLKGSKDVSGLLDFASNEIQPQTDDDRPVRQFLTSLLHYVDAAGACAANEGTTIVTGVYWDFASSSLDHGTVPASAGNRVLIELQQSWCAMLEVQKLVSEFGKAKQGGLMTLEEQDQTYQNLISQLAAWRSNAPEALQLFSQADGEENLQQYKYLKIVEQVSCVESFEMATHVYLRRIAAADRPDHHIDNVLIEMLTCRILFLAERFASGVRQLASVWPLFIAGQEAQRQRQRTFVRERMQDLQQYGFKVCLFFFFFLQPLDLDVPIDVV